MIRMLLERIDVCLTGEIEGNFLTESRPDRTIRLVGDPEHIHGGMELVLSLLEFQRLRGNVRDQLYPGGVRRRIEERSLHGGNHTAGLGASCTGLEFRILRRPR